MYSKLVNWGSGTRENIFKQSLTESSLLSLFLAADS